MAVARAARAGAAAICNAAPISAAQNAATNRNPFAFRQTDIIQASESARCRPVATSRTPPPSPQFAPPQRKEESGMNRSFLALWPDESALGDDRRRRLRRLASAGREAQESQRCSDSDENFLHGLSPFINHNRHTTERCRRLTSAGKPHRSEIHASNHRRLGPNFLLCPQAFDGEACSLSRNRCWKMAAARASAGAVRLQRMGVQPESTPSVNLCGEPWGRNAKSRRVLAEAPGFLRTSPY